MKAKPLSLPCRSVFAAASLLCAWPAAADTLELLWYVQPSPTHPWMKQNASARGVAVNPTNGNVLLVTGIRSADGDTPQVQVLDSSDGGSMWTLDTAGVAGGIFRMDMIGVADDGAVYVGNLDTKNSTPTPESYKLYRWANDNPNTLATVAFSGDPAGINEATGQSNFNERWGDSIDVRGAGANTQIAIAGNSSPAVTIFTTVDGENFTPHFIPDAGITGGSLSISFGPDITGFDDPATPQVENLRLITLYTTKVNQPLRRVGIRTDTWRVVPSTVVNYPTAAFPATVGMIDVFVPRNLLGSINLLPANDAVGVYDIANSANPPALIDQKTLSLNNPNSNAVGSVAFYQPPAGQGFLRVYYMNADNGLAAYELEPSTTPPEITQQPVSYTVIEGGPASFGIGVSGTPPLSYQWFKGEAELPNQTGPVLSFPNATTADAGEYKVRITNAAGEVTSNVVTLTVTPRVNTEVMTPAWKLGPGDRPYIDAGNLQRGLDYNPQTGNLLIVSRTTVSGLPNPAVIVLDAATGADKGPNGTVRTLKLTNSNDSTQNVAGGTFALNMVGVSDDGVVFSTNLITTSETSSFRVYRWNNDSGDAEPIRIYGPENLFGDRAGDSFDVRGGGPTTQLLVGARNQPKFAIFHTTDGDTYTPTVFELPAITVNGAFFGVAFGSGNTIWAKGEAGTLRRIEFNIGTGAASVTHEFPPVQHSGVIGPIGFDPARNLLAGIAVENPDNLQLHDLSNLSAPPVLLDQEFFLTDNPNINRTGAVAFGGGRVYALNTNNGIIAMNVTTAPPPAPPAISDVRLEAGAPNKLIFTLSGTAGRDYTVQGSTDLRTWQDLVTLTLSQAQQSVEVQVPAGQPQYFVRVKAE